MDASENRPLLGVVLVVMAMMIIGYIDNFIKVIAEDSGLWQFHFLRSLVICGTVWILAQIFGWRIRPRNFRAVLVRSLFFSGSMVLYFGAAGMMPIAQVGAGLFTSPIFVLVISTVFLGTRIGIWRIMAVLIGFAGVILILRPETTEMSVLTFIPLLAGLLYALNGIATRQWCEGETTTTLLFGLFAALGVWGFLGLLFFTFVPVSADLAAELPFFTTGWVTPTGRFMFWVVVQAVGSIVAVAMLTRGYQLAEVSFVAVFEYSFLVSAAFWAYFLWGEVLDLRAASGILAITLSGVIIALRAR